MRFDHDTETWWFRQSWLGDAIECNERGRRKIIQPDFDGENDAASAGTAAHWAVQRVLENASNLPVGRLAELEAERLVEELDIQYKSFSGPDEMIAHAIRCAEAWEQDIYPHITPGGLTEVPFQVPLFRRDNGVGVGIEGTVDYAPPIDSLLEDWKNKGRAMKQWELQRSDIQSIVYCTAAVKGGLESAWEEAGKTSPNYSWPMLFRFGNAVRGAKQAKGELVSVARTLGHERWLYDILNRFVDMAEVFGFDRPWLVNPTYVLCSEKWCPWWDQCQGKYISTEEHTWKP